MVFTMDRRTRRHLATAEEIVDSAEQIVLTADLESLTVAGIARGLEVTPGALYRYFPSRDAIVAAVQARVVRALADAVGRAVAEVDDPDPDLARLIALAQAVVGFARTEPVRYRLLSRMLVVPDPLVSDADAATVVPVALSALARAREALAVARTSGAIAAGDDDRRLLSLWAAIHGAIQLDKLRRFAPQAAVEVVSVDVVDDLLAGWGADRARIARVRARRLT